MIWGTNFHMFEQIFGAPEGMFEQNFKILFYFFKNIWRVWGYDIINSLICMFILLVLREMFHERLHHSKLSWFPLSNFHEIVTDSVHDFLLFPSKLVSTLPRLFPESKSYPNPNPIFSSGTEGKVSPTLWDLQLELPYHWPVHSPLQISRSHRSKYHFPFLKRYFVTSFQHPADDKYKLIETWSMSGPFSGPPPGSLKKATWCNRKPSLRRRYLQVNL